jgi:BlaI family penicillinase repressor
MKELTTAEEEIMQVLWQLEKAFVKEVIAELPEPKPAYNTVSTIIRILEKKEFVGYTAFGKSHQYHPIVSKEDYSKFALGQVVDGYFGGSVQKLVSFFVKENKVSVQDMDEILKVIKDNKGKNPKNKKS